MANVELCVLGSGSSGNSTFLACGDYQILIDAGLSARAITRRLAEIGKSPEDLNAILITHEHSDHCQGVKILAKKHNITLMANRFTQEAIARSHGQELNWQLFQTGQAFDLGPLQVFPFSIPHDAFDPVGFRIQVGPDLAIAFVTDLGHATNLVRQRIAGCRLLVLESNHDVNLLHDSPRPWSLKQRILGRQGHLSNHDAAALACEIAHPGLQHLILAHLSQDCNDANLALDTVGATLEAAGHTPKLIVARRREPIPLIQLQLDEGGCGLRPEAIREAIREASR
jgi:phosphoribosyl 1,2-cyclic phosphodiesterase